MVLLRIELAQGPTGSYLILGQLDSEVPSHCMQHNASREGEGGIHIPWSYAISLIFISRTVAQQEVQGMVTGHFMCMG